MLTLAALLREWRARPLQALLSLLGVAIGVAVVVAVDLSSVSAERQFNAANRVLEGVATHRVSGASGGVDEQLYTLIKVDLGIRDAAPLLQGRVTLGSGEGTLLGIDSLSDFRLRDFRLNRGGADATPFPLFVNAELAAQHDLVVGSELTLAHGRRLQDFTVVGTLDGNDDTTIPGDLMVTDIAAAQVFLDRVGRLSHIDLRLDARDVDTVRDALPPGINLIDTDSRNRARFEMTRAFRINLTALGMLALVIGLFLIYNTVSFQVVRRRPLFGLLRAVGVTGNGLFGYLLAEAGVIALLGVSVGLVLGVFLSQVLYGMVTGTIDALYFDLVGGVVKVSPWTLTKAAALGVGATLLAAAIPALEARNTPPRGLLARSTQETNRFHGRRWMATATLAVATALIILWLGSHSLIAAFAALFLLIMGSAAFAPALVVGLSRLLEPLAARFANLETVMAVRNVRAHLSRTGIATAALAVAVAATLGVGLMISSFRISVEDWLSNYLRADIYISMAQSDAPAFSDEFIASLAALDGVQSVSLGRRLTVDDPHRGAIEVFVLDTSAEGFAGFQVKSGERENLMQRFVEQGAVLVSEPFANRFDLNAGDGFPMATDFGRHTFPVAAVYYDYSSDQGVMAMSPETFERHYTTRGYRAASLHLDSGAENASQVLAEFERTLNTDGMLYARSNRALREASLQIFDQTFRVTGILRLLAMVVAVTGIVSALMALQLERAREYATLRATGFTRRQLGAQMLTETGLTGLAAGVLAVPIGVALCVLLIQVINLRSFGWSMQTVIDPVLVAQSIGLAVIAALVAGLYPAWRLRSLAIADNLRGD